MTTFLACSVTCSVTAIILTNTCVLSVSEAFFAADFWRIVSHWMKINYNDQETPFLAVCNALYSYIIRPSHQENLTFEVSRFWKSPFLSFLEAFSRLFLANCKLLDENKSRRSQITIFCSLQCAIVEHYPTFTSRVIYLRSEPIMRKSVFMMGDLQSKLWCNCHTNLLYLLMFWVMMGLFTRNSNFLTTILKL